MAGRPNDSLHACSLHVGEYATRDAAGLGDDCDADRSWVSRTSNSGDLTIRIHLETLCGSRAEFHTCGTGEAAPHDRHPVAPTDSSLMWVEFRDNRRRRTSARSENYVSQPLDE